MNLRKGERVSTFLWNKQKSDYDQNYHHLCQAGPTLSTLNPRAEIRLDKQKDRDITSYMKIQFGYLNNLKKEKEIKRI